MHKLLLQKSGITSWPLPLVANALPCLLELNISRNRISSVPDNAFAACASSLRELYMSGNWFRLHTKNDSTILRKCSVSGACSYLMLIISIPLDCMINV